MTLLALLNRVPALVLSSPLHPLMSRRRTVLAFLGRRTGRRYALPVNHLRRGRELLVTTDHGWWRNLDGGSPVEVTVRGRRVPAVAEAVREPAAVAEALTAMIIDHPPYGRWAHVRTLDGIPDPDDVRAEVARGRVLVRVRIPDDIMAG